MRWSVALGLIVVCGCGGTTVGVAPVRKAPVVKEAPKPVDLSAMGRPVKIGAPLDVRGSTTLWLRDTPVLVTLVTTRWDVIGDDETDPSSREGRATLLFQRNEETKKKTIDEGETATVFGFEVTVDYAFEVYDEGTSRWLPHAKFTVRRK